MRENQEPSPSRRDLLRSGAVAPLALSGAPLAAAGSRPAGPYKTQHVIVVAFAGGVRTRETLGTPANVPNMKRMADEGVAYMRALGLHLTGWPFALRSPCVDRSPLRPVLLHA